MNFALLLVAAVLTIIGLGLVVPLLFPREPQTAVGVQSVDGTARSTTLQSEDRASPATRAAQDKVTPAASTATVGMAALSAPDQAGAERTALAVTAAYARPASGTPEQEWWNQVAVWLTPDAESDYSGVSSAKIPYQSVTGSPALRYVGTSTARVSVLTDQGVWTVDLVRDSSKPYGWAVTRLGAAAAGE